MLTDEKGKFLAIDLGENTDKCAAIFEKKILQLSKDMDELYKIGSRLRELILNKYEPRKVTRALFGCYFKFLEEKKRNV